jgi:hypothetical protein
MNTVILTVLSRSSFALISALITIRYTKIVSAPAFVARRSAKNVPWKVIIFATM